MNKSKRVYAQLCGTCFERLNSLYRLKEDPAGFKRGGMGKCSMCDFRGELTEVFYEPARDKRPAQRTAPGSEEYFTEEQLSFDLAALEKEARA